MRTTTLFQIIGWVGVIGLFLMLISMKFFDTGNIYEFMILYGMTISWFIASIIVWAMEIKNKIPKSIKINITRRK